MVSLALKKRNPGCLLLPPRVDFAVLARPFIHGGAMIQHSIATNVRELTERMRLRGRAATGLTREAFKKSRPDTDAVLNAEMKAAFNVRDARAVRSWRLGVPSDRLAMRLTNLMRGFELHVKGGAINPRGSRALLIPINTRMGSRIGTKKFYAMIDWLRREKLTVIKGNILYVKPVMNTSRRGGVAAGTRVNKRFRARFQGSLKRPSGFDIKLNAEGLTPIAVLKRSVSMRARFDMDRIIDQRILPIVIRKIGAEFQAAR